MSAMKYFKDNLARLDAQSDPLSWNLNSGLLAMAKQLEELKSSASQEKQELQRIEQLVRHLPTR